MSDTVQALIRSGVSSERGLDMLQLFLGFISDYATKKLPHSTISMGNSNQEQVAELTVRLSNPEIVKNDESLDDNSREDSNSDSESESLSSDRSDSSESPEEKGKQPQRRRWTPLDELRLRAWVQEGKEWSWIAGKLQRSEQAIV
ncbi:hypothetical protein CKAH01_18976 [Colletotrichum kahawae]|uniref:Myb-like domain-containing protein n=1 Tax=Colletotrichum kahawae TaxID=34407 RepID=A0AAD9Y488_COLKA|nr:hypothetical protein CKAH01_18976 [Colletotrichum kahawae]